MAVQDKLTLIDDLKLQLSKLLPMTQEQEAKLDEKLRLEFHYNTNHIEGNTLTYGETKLAILFDQVSDGHKLRDYEEMKASDVAYKYIQRLAKEAERPLTEVIIKQLNEILLVREYYKPAITPDGQETKRLISIGEYKKHPNSVRLENGEIFHYASPTETPALMTDFVSWYRNEEEKKEYHPVIVAAMLHYRFVRIHPFDDGNGRVSRLLMNYVLFKHSYPPVVIKSEDKPNYLRALNKADAGDLDAFIEYIAEQLIWSLALSVKAAKGKDVEEQQDWKKKLAVLNRELADKKEIEILKSESIVQKIIFSNIIPLFDSILVEVQEFDKLFISSVPYIIGSQQPNILIKINNAVNLEERFKENINSFRDEVGLSYNLMQFKKNSTNTFSITANITVRFNLVEYSIFIDGNKLYSKYYNESITHLETETIVNKFASSLLNTIEIELSKTKSQ